MNTPDNGLQRVLAAPKDSLETVWQRLLRAIESTKIPVFSTIDHKQNAVEAGLDLPLRILAVETPQGVCLLWNDPTWIANRHGIVKNADVAQKMQKLMERLTHEAAQHQPDAGNQ